MFAIIYFAGIPKSDRVPVESDSPICRNLPVGLQAQPIDESGTSKWAVNITAHLM
jgi:hypothetical protein